MAEAKEKVYANFRSPSFNFYYANGSKQIIFKNGVFRTANRIEQAAIEDHRSYGTMMLDTGMYDSVPSSSKDSDTGISEIPVSEDVDVEEILKGEK